MLYCFIRYNTAFLDYFYLELHKRSYNEIRTYANTLSMYRFQKKMNSKKAVAIFKNKILFHQQFNKFIKHNYFLPLESSFSALENWLLLHHPENIICKRSNGQAGKNIFKFNVIQKNNSFYIGNLSTLEFHNFLSENKLDLIEINIKQHPLLKNLHPESLNTIRVISIIDKNNDINILGAILRIGTNNSIIDNFSANGIAAKISLESGIIETPVVIKDPRIEIDKNSGKPFTNSQLIGLELPFWQETLSLVKSLCKVLPEAKTIGWDIAITSTGPQLLEGNHNWGKLLWQKTHERGLKPVLEAYIS